MSQQVQELIDKIKAEGLQAADQKAKEIEDQAQEKTREIIADAQKQAQALITQAEEEIKKKEESVKMALRQASRDMLLTLKGEIQGILHRIIAAKVKDTLTIENLARIIGEVSKKAIDENQAESGVEVILSPKDLKGLKDGFIAQLQKQLKKPIEFKASDDFGKGFAISFDEGKSSFDFTQASLAEYLSVYLNEQVAELLKESVNEDQRQ